MITDMCYASTTTVNEGHVYLRPIHLFYKGERSTEEQSGPRDRAKNVGKGSDFTPHFGQRCFDAHDRW